MESINCGVETTEEDGGGQAASPEVLAQNLFAIFTHPGLPGGKVYFQDAVRNPSHGKIPFIKNIFTAETAENAEISVIE